MSSLSFTVYGEKTVKRFWSKVQRHGPGDCWPWQASTRRGGYGQVYVGTGRADAKLISAHRVAWIITNGPIPDGMVPCHRCDNPPCCNPAHLFLGTRKDNVADMIAKGRNSKPPRRVGENHPRARLTDDSVRKIRRLFDEGISKNQIAPLLGVDRRTVQRVLRGVIWKHVS